MKVLISLQQELNQTTKYLFQDSRYQDWDLKPGLKRSAMFCCTILQQPESRTLKEKKETVSFTLMKYIENGLVERSDIT